MPLAGLESLLSRYDQAWVSQEGGWVKHHSQVPIDAAHPGDSPPSGGREQGRQLIVGVSNFAHTIGQEGDLCAICRQDEQEGARLGWRR
jgi:hypothetical protein